MRPAVQHAETVMGTVVTIDIWVRPGTGTTSLAAIGQQAAMAVAILHRADDVFSTWQRDSPVSRLRRGDLDVADAPAEVRDVIDACVTARTLSAGWFDPWAMPGGFDPTGYVKGWAAQRALAALRDESICGAIVNAAGDAATAGCLPSGEPFRIGIADPAAPRRLAAIATVTGGIATSGSYERGEHLIDPASGRPVSRAASATVTGPDLGLADALATALAVAGPGHLDLIESIAGYEALLIETGGRQTRTAGLQLA